MTLLLQLLINGIVQGCEIALVALGFTLIYNTTKIFNFAYAGIYMVSAYVLYTLLILFGRSIAGVLAALVLGAFVIAGLGVGLDEVVHKPLLKRGSSPLVHMLSSIASYLIIVNLISLFYGNEIKTFSTTIQSTVAFIGFVLTQSQLATILAFLVVVTVFFFFIKETRLGTLVRALSDDGDLLSTLGADPMAVRRATVLIASVLAYIPSVLMTFDRGINPQSGMSVLFTAVVAMIIGGTDMLWGVVLGGLLLGSLEGLIVWQTSSQWKDLFTFLALILILLLRPKGLFSNPGHREETPLS